MKYEIDQLVFHVGVIGKIYRILREVGPSQYEIIDDENNTFIEPSDCFLSIDENRDRIIKFIINEE